MITMYNVVSADGYISRLDRSEDYIPSSVWPRFLDLCREYGVIIIGRKTYESLESYAPSLLQAFHELDLKKIVVSRDVKFTPKENKGYFVVHSPKEALEMSQKFVSLESKGVLLSSGPTLNTSMLCEGLIDKAIIDKLPVRFGEGLKIFEEGIEPPFALISKEDNGGGMERCFYDVSEWEAVEAGVDVTK